MDSLVMSILGIVGLIVFVVLIFKFSSYLTAKTSQKADAIIQDLAKQSNVYPFRYDIGNIDKPFCVDTKHNCVLLKFTDDWHPTRYRICLTKDITQCTFLYTRKILSDAGCKAIVGGLLLGPVGAVAGAASGNGAPRVDKLFFQMTIENKPYKAFLGVDNEYIRDIKRYFEQYMEVGFQEISG